MKATQCPVCKSEKEFLQPDVFGEKILFNKPRLISIGLGSVEAKPCICQDCGYVMFFVPEEKLQKLK